jgi:hypothetical protein
MCSILNKANRGHTSAHDTQKYAMTITSFYHYRIQRKGIDT